MRRTFRMRSALVLALALSASASPALAERLEEYAYHKGTFALGGGINSPVGGINQYFNSSGTVFFGGGRNVTQRFALEIEYTHNWLSVDNAVIQRATTDTSQVQSAHTSLWSVTLNGILRFGPESDLVPWITAGGGYYKRNVLLTENALVYYPPVFDPWWGWIDGGWGPGEAIVGQHASSGFGFNVGAGIDFRIEGGSSLFLDARYHMAYMDGVDMQLVPVTFGIRW